MDCGGLWGMKMAETETVDWAALPFAQWLEESIQELVKAKPIAIGMQMIDEYGMVHTCYYNTSANDRACMIDAMRDDARFEFIYANREEIRAILEDEGEEDDGLQDADPETDSEDG